MSASVCVCVCVIEREGEMEVIHRCICPAGLTGALEQLQAELCRLQAQWVEREEQVKKMCESKQREVQEEA